MDIEGVKDIQHRQSFCNVAHIEFKLDWQVCKKKARLLPSEIVNESFLCMYVESQCGSCKSG